MLHPSYSELMEVLNERNTDLDNKITSRYTIVIAAAKRARQIVNGAPCDTAGVTTDKAVSIAVNEIDRGRIQVLPDGSPEDEYPMYEPAAYDYASMTEPAGELDFGEDDFDDDDVFMEEFDSSLDDEVFGAEDDAIADEE